MRDPGSGDLDAGAFGPWLRATAAVAAGEGDADVPCGTCTACCRSSYFVHVAPEDVAARRRIPAELLFPAPGRPPGHLLMGYDERGWSVEAAARFLMAHADALGGLVPRRPADLAVAAIRVHGHFLGGQEPNPDAVVAALRH